MKELPLNDEEYAMLHELTGFTKAEKIKILTDSIFEETDAGSKRILRSFLSKLKNADDTLSSSAPRENLTEVVLPKNNKRG